MERTFCLSSLWICCLHVCFTALCMFVFVCIYRTQFNLLMMTLGLFLLFSVCLLLSFMLLTMAHGCYANETDKMSIFSHAVVRGGLHGCAIGILLVLMESILRGCCSSASAPISRIAPSSVFWWEKGILVYILEWIALKVQVDSSRNEGKGSWEMGIEEQWIFVVTLVMRRCCRLRCT